MVIDGGIQARGRDESSRCWRTPATGALTLAAGDDRHLVANIEIALDGDSATASSTWVYLTRADGLAMVGRYADTLRRTADG